MVLKGLTRVNQKTRLQLLPLSCLWRTNGARGACSYKAHPLRHLRDSAEFSKSVSRRWSVANSGTWIFSNLDRVGLEQRLALLAEGCGKIILTMYDD